jgi:hypothetical protein
LPVVQIDRLLKGGTTEFPLQESLGPSFKSWYTLHRENDELDIGLGIQFWKTVELDYKWKARDSKNIKFYYRDIVGAAQWLL